MPVVNEKVYAPPMSERDAARRDPANAKKLWTIEVIFYDPENANDLRRHISKNLLYVEFREFRASIFSEGLLFPIGDRADLRYCVVPPSAIRNIYATKQKNFIDG
jgi:hypothetical protein